MQPQYDSWSRSAHHHVAGCVDCHLPHDFIGKYYTKAEHGYRHSQVTRYSFERCVYSIPMLSHPAIGSLRLLRAVDGDLLHLRRQARL
jgi:hypothetical protein